MTMRNRSPKSDDSCLTIRTMESSLPKLPAIMRRTLAFSSSTILFLFTSPSLLAVSKYSSLFGSRGLK